MNENVTLYTVLRAHGMRTLATKPPVVLEQYRTVVQARADHHRQLIREGKLNEPTRCELINDVYWYAAILLEIDVLLAANKLVEATA